MSATHQAIKVSRRDDDEEKQGLVEPSRPASILVERIRNTSLRSKLALFFCVLLPLLLICLMLLKKIVLRGNNFEAFADDDYGPSSHLTDGSEVGDEDESDPVESFEIKAKCIPSVCFREIDFMKHAKPITSEKVSLSTFPGSGNTWTRSFLEQGTRVWSGSIYKKTFESKMSVSRDPDEKPYSTLIVTKNHFPSMESDVNPIGGIHHGHEQDYSRVIIVLRDPFDAMVADYQRLYGDSTNNEISPQQHWLSQQRFFTREFHEYVLWRENGFKRFVRFWLPPRFWEISEKNPPKNIKLKRRGLAYDFTFEKFVGFDPEAKWAHQSEYRVKPRTVSVLLAFYEDLTHDFVGTVEPIFDYLRDTFKELVPDRDTATVCAIVNQQKEERFHRKKKSKQPINPFQVIPSINATVPDFCKKVAEHWATPMWGPCEEALLQKYRNATIRRVTNVPTERCSD